MRGVRLALLLALTVLLTASAQQSATDYLSRGEAQRTQGQLDEAIASLREATELLSAYATKCL